MEAKFASELDTVFVSSRNTPTYDPSFPGTAALETEPTVESEIEYKYFVTKITAFGHNKLLNLQMLN